MPCYPLLHLRAIIVLEALLTEITVTPHGTLADNAMYSCRTVLLSKMLCS